MKTIEERAKEYSYKIHYGNSPLDNHLRGRERTIYLDAAKEQRKIDIEKACEWMKDFKTGDGEFPLYNFVGNLRKAMGDKYVE